MKQFPTDIEQHQIEPGIYEHYKGPKYRVFGTAQHSETEEWLVVYQALYGEHGFWVRPLTMFTETVNHNDQVCPRFRKISD
jgi:hypothetical protein